jgi:hypothetical protein
MQKILMSEKIINDRLCIPVKVRWIFIQKPMFHNEDILQF